MKTFKSHLKETTLSRVFRHFKNKKIPVGIITAFRGTNTYDENVKRNKVLAGKIKNEGYGYFFVEGHWQETDGDEKIDVKEDSIFVVGSNNDNGKLKGLFKKWLGAYNQEAALYKDAGTTTIVLLDKSGKGIEISNKFSLKKLEIGYTKLRGRSKSVFSFDEERDGEGWLGRMERLIKERQKK